MPQFNTLWRHTIGIYFLLLHLYLSADIVRTFEYDKNNHLIKEKKTNGQAVAYEYDPCGRIVRTTSSDGITVEYAYDLNGNCIRMSDSHGTTTYSYDLLNQLVKVQFPESNPLSYMYDARGRLTEMIYPNGSKIAYRYDSSSRLTAVTDQTGETKYEYDDAANTLCKVTLPNGIFTEYQYDPTKRITHVTHKRSSGEVIKSYHYTFDANGNRTQIKETGSNRAKTTLCTYDKLNRLIAVEYPEGYEKFTYDGIGNRLSKETQHGVTRYEYDQRNRLVKAGDIQFFYDQCGNLIKKASPKETVEYTYDAYDNLIEFRNDKSRVKYAYDGARRRISKNIDGVVTHYINDVQSPITQVVLQTTASNEIVYTYGLARLAEILPKGVGFYLYDYPDRNVVGLVDRDQRIVNEYGYDSFGCCQRIGMDSPNDFLYAGEAYEKESGLIYLRNRYYDPELGRFISADPEFGSTMNPQSLNHYTYVNNNPFNYIDPSGLRSAKACAYPAGTKTKDGTSTFGHGFWVLTYDNGEVKTIGRHPGKWGKGYKEDYDKIVAGTVSYEWPATDNQIDQIIKSVQKGPYLGVYNNCIDGLERGFKVLDVKHPSFDHFGASAPYSAVLWLESQNGNSEHYDAYQDAMRLARDPENYVPNFEKKSKPPVVTKSAGDVGGVSLNKTATLLGKISEVEGATYDDNTGQLIVVGKKKNIKLPEMDFDDLAVAVKSIYGLGGKHRQNPGVSLDPDPGHPVDMKKIIEKGKSPPDLLVRYVGQTKNTRFGSIMFEADSLLKCLSLGKDNLKKKKMKMKVAGFKTIPEMHKKNRRLDGQFNTRLWFVPKEMSIYKNRKGNSIVFKEAKMQVLTETKFKSKTKSNDAAERFAEHFTKNYDKFAKHYPVLQELKRLGKITAVVKWMRENKIPIDLELFKKYKPTHHDTPKKTPAISFVEKEGNETGIYTFAMVGGVIYDLDQSNFHEAVNDNVDPLTVAALQARPSDTVFEWTFKSPIDSATYQAVAQTIERTLKVGSMRKSCLDMRFHGFGGYPLELVRYYNSFNDNDIGFGRGWDVVCTRLRFNREKVNVQWKGESTPVAVYPEIFAEVDGQEARYTLQGLGADRNPIYKSEENRAFLVETKSGYTLSTTSGKHWKFTFEGKIIECGQRNNGEIYYRYNDDNQLVGIEHASGKKIELRYTNKRLTQSRGPGDKVIFYGYDPQGMLCSVADSLGTLESYGYDAESNLNSVSNLQNIQIFNAVYDEYHRAISEKVFGKQVEKSFNLRDHTLNADVGGKSLISSKYDAKYRLLEAADSAGREVQITYDEGQANPKSISDCMGYEKKYDYDRFGNIARTIDSQGTETRFWYNKNDQLSACLDPMGRAELYFYDNQGRLFRICHLAQLVSEDRTTGNANFSVNHNYMTEYGYDATSGHLLWIKKNGELVESFVYDNEGMLIQVNYPSGYSQHLGYDARGRVTKLWDTDGLQYAYDERDRLISMANFDGKIESKFEDSKNSKSILDGCGGLSTYRFDAFGKLLELEDASGGVTHYEYDENQNLKRITLPNGSIREIAYDTLYRPHAEGW